MSAPGTLPAVAKKADKTAPEWKLGDTVYLKSGSPRMTVAALMPLVSGPHVKVVWTKYDDGVMQETILPAEVFRKDWK